MLPQRFTSVTPRKIIIMKVPEPGFFLKRPDIEKQTAIMMVVRINKNEILKYYTRESIEPSNWDFEEKRAKEGVKYPEGWQINTRLEKFRLFFKSTFRKLVDEKNMPTRTIIKSAMDREFFDFILNDGNLIDYFKHTIERMETNKLMTIHGKPYSIGTIKTYNTSLKHLVDFGKISERKIDFDTIDMSFYYEYLDYFYTNNYSTNGIYMPIKRLKQILRQAEEEGYHVNSAYKSKRFVTPLEQVDKIYHPESEIKRIYEYKYELFSNEDKIRDRYVIACYTGLRFSDYKEIKKENIFKNEYGEFLRITANKTGIKATIPLNFITKKILEKYNYELPRVISNQHFNDYLKQIGEDAEINEPVTIISTKGGKRIETTYKKYKLMQTHTARRSFATNLYLQGYSTIEIMKVTGHRTEHEFLKYIRISGEEAAFKIASDPKFKQEA